MGSTDKGANAAPDSSRNTQGQLSSGEHCFMAERRAKNPANENDNRDNLAELDKLVHDRYSLLGSDLLHL